MNIQEILNNDEKFRYQLLSRMQSDCGYYLGNDGKSRHPKHLWAGDEKEQIEYMKAIWNSFPEDKKPEWLSYEQILEYEKQMVIPDFIKDNESFIDVPEPQNSQIETLLGYENGFLMGKDDVEFHHYASNNPELPYGFYDCDQSAFVFSDFEKNFKMLKEYVQNGADGTYAIISKQGEVSINSEEYAEIKDGEFDISGMDYEYFRDINEIVWSAYKVCGEMKEYFLEDLIQKTILEKLEKDASLCSLGLDYYEEELYDSKNIYTLKEFLELPFSEHMEIWKGNKETQQNIKNLISEIPNLFVKEKLSEKIEAIEAGKSQSGSINTKTLNEREI